MRLGVGRHARLGRCRLDGLNDRGGFSWACHPLPAGRRRWQRREDGLLDDLERHVVKAAQGARRLGLDADDRETSGPVCANLEAALFGPVAELGK
jgi:hypothetical protein